MGYLWPMTLDLLDCRFTPVQAMAVTGWRTDRKGLVDARSRRLLTAPSPPTALSIGLRYSLLGLYELRILAEAAESGIDRKIVAWGFRKRLQAVGGLQLIKESGGKPVGFYGGVGEADAAGIAAALRSGRLYEFERRDPADGAYWLIGFEREAAVPRRSQLVWVETVATRRAELGPALLALKPRASQVTGVVLVDVTAAVNAVHRVLDDLEKDREVARPGVSSVH